MTRTLRKRNRRSGTRVGKPPMPSMTDGTVGIRGSIRLTPRDGIRSFGFPRSEDVHDADSLPSLPGPRTDPTPVVGCRDARVSPAQSLDAGRPGPTLGRLGLDLEPAGTRRTRLGSRTPGTGRRVPRLGARNLGTPGGLVGRTPRREDGNFGLALSPGRGADPSSCRDSWTTSRVTEGGTSPGGGTSAGVPVIGRVVPFSRVVVDDRGRALPPTDLR